MSVTNVFAVFFLGLLSLGCISARWCTRLKSEKLVERFFEYAQCNKSYHAACGWFTRQQCTFYELVECPREVNHTVIRYKIVEECCAGYVLDPINNITCIRSDDADNHAVPYYESDEDGFLGLSHGAYAGIICSMLFVLCVSILIALHVHKRKRNERMKASKETTEMEMATEKMIPATQA